MTTTASRSSYETWASPPVLGNYPLPQAVPASKELSRALAEHDVTVAGSSLSNEEAQAFMAEHG
jgi:hypothetical protein